MKSETFYTFKRLITTFAKPYTARLTVGILAGFLAGGSLFGMLSFMPGLIQSFEASPPAERPVDQVEATGDRVGSIERLAEKYGISATRENGQMTWNFMLLTIGGMVVVMLVKAGATFVNRYCLRWVGARVVVDLRNALFASLQNQSLTFYGKIDVGRLISRCTYDTALVENAIAKTIADLARAPIEIMAAAAFILITAAKNDLGEVVIGLFLVFPLCVLPIVILGRFVKRYTRRALERISDLVSRMQENFTGIRVVKAFHMEEAEKSRFEAMNQKYFKVIIRALRVELAMTPLMEFVGVICACGFVAYCYARGISLDQILPIGAAAVFAYKPLKQLAKINVDVQRTVAAGERLFELLDTDTSLPEAENPIQVRDFTDRIVFDHVGFAYEPGGLPVLTDIGLDIPKGSVVAFVGETGSGKTTVANLLARFYDPVSGSILLDGMNLKDLEIASLRQLVGVVTQETILFNDTIANNIKYGTLQATMDEVVEAAKKANAHEFIIAEKEGYDRVVGEKGFLLSGGQRQRLAVARAILKNPPILILDEATSALDTATEHLVQEAINRVMADRTVFAIAHRLSTIKHADQICVLDKGIIVERGTHQELYDAGGRYRKLCDMQFS